MPLKGVPKNGIKNVEKNKLSYYDFGQVALYICLGFS